MTKAVDLYAGQKFGDVEVIKKHHTKIVYYGKRKVTKDFYLCRCKCGKEFLAYKHNLTRNVDRIESCGCIRGTHHLTKTRCMRIFYGMRKRCYDKNCIDYKNYGGRGIKICAEWYRNCESFYNWAMNNGYADNLTIERIDVNKDYCPENCKWITKAEQSANRRNVIKIIFDGEMCSISEISKKTGIKHGTIDMRIRRTGRFTKEDAETIAKALKKKAK